MRNRVKPTVISLLVASLVGCTSNNALDMSLVNVETPKQWQGSNAKDNGPILNDWFLAFNDNTLNALIQNALSNNYDFKANQFAMQLAQQQVVISGASLLPELSLNATQSRKKSVTETGTKISNSADISAKLSYEVDLWGKLSDEQRRANLALASAKHKLKHQELNLVATVARTWFDLVSANQLLALYQQRANNQTRNLDIIQSSYRLGLNQALDVYLTQNNVNSEKARVIDQQHQVQKLQRQLELLIGEYPKGVLSAPNSLPLITKDIALSEPSQLLTQRFDIASSWYDLLASDASLAIAHKKRFPSFTLTASTGDSADKLSNLLDGNALAWSLLGNITAPIFNSGRLEAAENQAELTLRQKEQRYLEQVYQAFADVENAIGNRQALKQRYQHFLQAKENAEAAEKLAFDQYMKGLVSYTSVLESQRRAFDAQTQLIQLTNQLLQNRINLYVSLGGSNTPLFSTNQTQYEVKS